MWQVRPARLYDLPAIEALVAAAGGDREELREDQFLVAEDDDGAILGCGRLKPYASFVELASLAVGEQTRASGVGREIVTRLVAWGQRPLYLICEDDVVDFFRRFGFGLIPISKIPAELLPKWQRYAAGVDHLNLMRWG